MSDNKLVSVGVPAGVGVAALGGGLVSLSWSGVFRLLGEADESAAKNQARWGRRIQATAATLQNNPTEKGFLIQQAATDSKNSLASMRAATINAIGASALKWVGRGLLVVAAGSFIYAAYNYFKD